MGWADERVQWLSSSIDWGDAPTWVATLGALGALLIAWRALRIERNREDARLAQDLSAQASRVAAWVAVDLGPVATRSSPSRLQRWIGITSPLRGGVLVRNVSELPVYSAEIIIYNAAPFEVARIPVGTIAPGETRYFKDDLERHSGVDIRDVTTGRYGPGRGIQWDSVLAGVAFYDAGDQRWQRDFAGRLKYLGDGGPPRLVGRDPGLHGWMEAITFCLKTARLDSIISRLRPAPPTIKSQDHEERELRC